MKKLNKKGFTIIELVIVIAVIAILAGVMIPTFSSIVTKANESAAQQEAMAYYKEVYALDLSDGVLDAKENGKASIAVGEFIYSTTADAENTDKYTMTITKIDGKDIENGRMTYVVEDNKVVSFTYNNGTYTSTNTVSNNSSSWNTTKNS